MRSPKGTATGRLVIIRLKVKVAHIRDMHPEDTLLLHADEDDTPKDMYLKMGFDIVDRLYEYTRTGIDD